VFGGRRHPRRRGVADIGPGERPGCRKHGQQTSKIETFWGDCGQQEGEGLVSVAAIGECGDPIAGRCMTQENVKNTEREFLRVNHTPLLGG
jgi:hypothetical protein